ncbi:MAG: SDR family oxidoreductase [Anaerolineae bacterium]|nr:SDR family oxidoreductase [Anaerolineae bacterium]
MQLPLTDRILKNKIALVTGAGRGIGRVIAGHLAAAGAEVFVAARSESDLQQTVEAIVSQGHRASKIVVDITDQTAVDQMLAHIESQSGHLDILVNNAGTFGPIGPLWESDSADWWQTLEVNLRGTYLCLRAALPGMVNRRSGHIINLSSSIGVRPTPHTTAYSVSKAAVAHLTACLALETKGHGVAVFALHPGTVLTDMTRTILETEAGQAWLPRTRNTFEEKRDFPPERAADIVVQLASGVADKLSGRFIFVTDDLPDLIRQAETTPGT